MSILLGLLSFVPVLRFSCPGESRIRTRRGRAKTPVLQPLWKDMRILGTKVGTKAVTDGTKVTDWSAVG
jgi:hypothetical protein